MNGALHYGNAPLFLFCFFNDLVTLTMLDLGIL